MGVLELPRSAGYTCLQSWIVALLVLNSVKLSEGFAVSPWSYPRPSSSGTVMFAAKPDDTNPPPPQHVVIAGAGVIGVSTAYFLAKNHGIRTTLVDPTGHIAPAASGKAGGFLARDWNDYGPTGPLTHRSFQLHQQLADDLGVESIQYRRLKCASIQVDPASGRRPAGKKLQGVEWVDNSLGMQELGDEETIAQVHPKMLCERMWEETVKLVPECTLKQGKVVGSARGPDDKFEGANIMGEDGNEMTLRGDALLYACGPWTKGIMYGIKYHSVILPTDRVLNQCVFFSGCGDPEVYVRPDSTAYCTGFPEPARVVTEKPGEELVSADGVKTIVDAVHKASNGALSLKTDTATEQACYLPTTEDGIPVMGAISGNEGCFIASGHTCWGILLGPASGESMANLIATGSSPHVDLDPFTPRRFGNIE